MKNARINDDRIGVIARQFADIRLDNKSVGFSAR